MSTLIVKTKNTYPNLMKELIRLKAWDEEIERKRKTWGWMVALSVICAILAIIGVAKLSSDSVNQAVYIFPSLFAISFVVSLVIYLRQVSKDLDNRKLETAMSVVARIGEDIPPESQCAITIDFKEYRKGGSLVSKSGSWLTGHEFLYVHPWLNFSGKLYDGNKFDVLVETYVKRKEKRKRKYTKVKEAFSEKATLTVRLNPEIYPDPAQVAGNISTGITPYGFEIKRAIGTDKALKVTLETGSSVIVHARGSMSGTLDKLLNGDRLLGLFIQTYAGIAKARPEGAVPAQ